MQAKLKDFHLKISRKPLRPEIRLMDVSSEIGELTKEILKATEYGSKTFFATSEFKEELGDLLYSVLSLCEECDLSAEELLQKTLAKYESRWSKTGQLGSSVE